MTSPPSTHSRYRCHVRWLRWLQ